MNTLKYPARTPAHFQRPRLRCVIDFGITWNFYSSLPLEKNSIIQYPIHESSSDESEDSVEEDTTDDGYACP